MIGLAFTRVALARTIFPMGSLTTTRERARRNLPSALAAVLLFASGALATGCAKSRPAASTPPAPTASAGLEYTSVLVHESPHRESWDQRAAAVPVSSDDPSWGRPDAPVTIVEFSDFECPFSSRVQPTLAALRERYGPERLRIVWKHNPLPFHKASRPAHDAAAIVFALGGSDAFWKLHDRVFANQQILVPENLRTWALEAGVDGESFDRAVSRGDHTAKVDEDMALARRVGATGTPAFRINGVTVSGAQPFEKFTAAIDEQLAAAERLIASGVAPGAVYVALTGENFVEPPPKARGESDGSPQPAEEDTSVWKVPVLSDDPKRGPADALVTIVQFSEFQCPFCKMVKPTLDRLLAAFPDDVRLVWKDNPLPFHPRARPAAIFARIVYQKRGDEAFWQVHDALFQSQPELEDETFEAIAKKLGIGWNSARRAIERNQAKKIDDNMDLAFEFAARGTPHFFINGVRLAGAQPYEKFYERVSAELAKAGQLVADGIPRSRIYATILKDAREPAPPERKEVPAPDKSSPYRGSPYAKIVIQEFSDFQCPFCRRVQPTLAELEKLFPGRVKIVWRNLPLPFHRDAALAAEAAQEVFEQRGSTAFFRYHDKLFEAQDQPSGLERPNLERLAEESAIDMTRFRRALDTRLHRAKVEHDAEIAAQAGINGTPGFVINGYFLSGAQSIAVFRRLVERAVADGKARVK